MDTQKLWRLRLMGWSSVLLLVIGLNCTAAQRIHLAQEPAGRDFGNDASQYPNMGLHSWNEIEPLSSRIVLGLCFIALLLFVTKRWKALQIVGVAVLFAVVYGWNYTNQLVGTILSTSGQPLDSYYIASIPAYLLPSMGVAWWPLFAGAILLWATGWMGAPPTWKFPPLHQRRLPKGSGWNRPRGFCRQTPVSDVGACAQCHQPNSHHAVHCYACGALLPWAKLRPKAAPPSGPANSAPVFIKPKSVPPSVNHEALMLWIYGTGLFLFCLAVPLLGFFVWRAMLNTDSELTPFAGAGSILGIALWLGVFGLVMSRLGAPANP